MNIVESAGAVAQGVQSQVVALATQASITILVVALATMGLVWFIKRRPQPGIVEVRRHRSSPALVPAE